jgi:hypothetical protein
MTTPEAPEVTLLRRTLEEVAASLDVADAPLPPEAQVGRDHRRPFGWRAPLAVAAAVVVLAAGVWAVLRSTDGADDSAPADDVTTDTGDTPRAGWLPGWLAESGTGGAKGMPVERARLLTGTGPDDVAVILDVAAGTGVAERAASYVAPYVGSPVEPGTGRTVASEAPGSSSAILWRRAEPPPTTLFDTSVSGWPGEDVDMGWVPGVGDTVSVAYEGAASGEEAPSLVELHAVGAGLPAWGVLATLLDDEAQVEVGKNPAWFVPLGGPGDGHAVVWQPAPGVTAVITGWRVAEADLLRIAEESTWPASLTVEDTGATPATGVEERVLAGPEDWPTLCDARPGDPALPGEDAGESSVGVIGVTGTSDIPYELLLWEDRVTAAGPERTGQCWRLSVGPELDRFRGGGEVITQGWGPATTLVPVAWTAEETVFLAASTSDLMIAAINAEVIYTTLDEEMEDGTRFTFLRVERVDGQSEIGFELRDAGGDVLGHAGPLPLDRPA